MTSTTGRRARTFVAGALSAALVGGLAAAAPAQAGSAPEQPGQQGQQGRPDRGGPPGGPGNGRPAYTLTVLHGNDMESQLLGIGEDGDGDGRPDYGGVDRHATVIDQLRRQATRGRPDPGEAGRRGALVLSAGDNFLAGPELSASLADDDGPVYDALGMQLTGYDASAVGNHEFDFGPDFFDRFVTATDGAFPFVSANLDYSGEPDLQELVDDGPLVERTVVRKRGARIGLVGLTTPQLPTVSSPGDVTVSDELVAAVQDQVAALQDRGVSKIAVLSHLQDIDRDRALAGQLRGVDIMVGGGGGELVANADDALVPGDERSTNPDTGEPYSYPIVEDDAEGDPVPIVTTPGEYAYVGKLTVSFDRDGDVIPGSWSGDSGAVRVSGTGSDAVEPDAEVHAQVVEPVTAHVESLQDTVVATSEVGLNGIREDVRTRETNLGALLSDALLWTGRQRADEFGVQGPDIAVQNGGGIRNDSVIGSGDVTAFDTFSVAPFPNFVAVQPDVSCASVKALLERGVAALPNPAGQFTQVAGLSMAYDPDAQAQQVDETTGEITTEGERVRSVTLDDGTQVVSDGQVVEGCEPLTLATNDFSARGGDAYPLGDYEFTNVGTTYRQALANYLTGPLEGTVAAEQYSPEAVSDRIQPVD